MRHDARDLCFCVTAKDTVFQHHASPSGPGSTGPLCRHAHWQQPSVLRSHNGWGRERGRPATALRELHYADSWFHARLHAPWLLPGPVPPAIPLPPPACPLLSSWHLHTHRQTANETRSHQQASCPVTICWKCHVGCHIRDVCSRVILLEYSMTTQCIRGATE